MTSNLPSQSSGGVPHLRGVAAHFGRGMAWQIVWQIDWQIVWQIVPRGGMSLDACPAVFLSFPKLAERFPLGGGGFYGSRGSGICQDLPINPCFGGLDRTWVCLGLRHESLVSHNKTGVFLGN